MLRPSDPFYKLRFCRPLYEFRSNNLHDFGFRIVTLGHTDNRADFRSSIVADMKNKVGSVVITGVYGNMGDVPGRNVFEK